jgi:putative membrane protein
VKQDEDLYMTAIPGVHPQRRLRDYIRIALCGVVMGSADVVPGVSGGTMAFILGIYEELVESIKAFSTPAHLRLVLTLRWGEALHVLPWRFLAALGLGIVTAVVTLARGVSWMLEHRPVFLWAVFFGLVLASVVTVSRQLKKWDAAGVLGVALAAAGAYLFVGLVPVQTPNDWWFLILSGAIAICAMILPGISGAFVLVLLGKYQYVLDAVNNRDVVTVLLVGLGCAVGIVTFAQVVSYLFKRYHGTTVAVLTGLMVGSLRKVWPWKETVRTMLDSHGNLIPLQEINVLPAAVSAEVWIALGLAVLGFSLVVALDRVALRRGSSPA